MKSQLAELVLTCGSWQEAQNIADHLLDNKLADSIEFMEIKSKSLWNEAVDMANEVKLVILADPKRFEEIEAAVSGLHRYDTKTISLIGKEING